jgi:polar amino acid transport system substrate-binding protein
MKKYAVISILIIGLALMFAGCGQSEQAEEVNVRMELTKQSTLDKIIASGELRHGFEAGYMPFEMTDKNGDFIGFDIDMGKKMAEAMGVKWVPVNTAWDGIIPSLMTDKFDIIMSGMTVTQERNLKISFAEPYIVIGQAIIVNSSLKGTISSYKDLNDPKYTVISKLGTTGEQAVMGMIPKANYKAFETESEGAMEVLSGNADAFVYDLPFAELFMTQRGESGSIFILNKPFTYEPLAWAINKGDPDFLNWLNNFMKQVKNDGTYDAIYDKWIKNDDWLKEVE